MWLSGWGLLFEHDSSLNLTSVLFSKFILYSSECWTVQLCKVEVMLDFTCVGLQQQLEYLAKYYLAGRSFGGGLMPEVDL